MFLTMIVRWVGCRYCWSVALRFHGILLSAFQPPASASADYASAAGGHEMKFIGLRAKGNTEGQGERSGAKN
jgi:hypothetical protein